MYRKRDKAQLTMDEFFIPFGAEHIKDQGNLTGEGTAACLCGNPYAQYLAGLKAFCKEPLFEASMMAHFRKRFTPELMQRINGRKYEHKTPSNPSLR